jgi:diguanylate cyclase (GGDEF)-like protein
MKPAALRQTDFEYHTGPERQTADELRQRIQLLEAVINNFPGGILLFDRDLRLVLCNRQQQSLLEYPDSLFAAGAPSLEQIIRFNAQRGEYGPGRVEDHVAMRMALVAEKRPHVFERTRPNGTALQIRGVPLPEGGFVTTYLDVTEQRKNQALISYLAHHDPVTGLANRTKMLEHLGMALASVKSGCGLALHYIDLDQFKPVNDKLGHAIGDAILKSAAERMLGAVREADIVARVGGDEFVIVQTLVRSSDHAKSLAGRVIKALSQAHSVEGESVLVSASVGIALAPLDGAAADELLQKADKAMYRSKETGGGKATFHADLC